MNWGWRELKQEPRAGCGADVGGLGGVLTLRRGALLEGGLCGRAVGKAKAEEAGMVRRCWLVWEWWG